MLFLANTAQALFYQTNTCQFKEYIANKNVERSASRFYSIRGHRYNLLVFESAYITECREEMTNDPFSIFRCVCLKITIYR